jgi:hypothetical protein
MSTRTSLAWTYLSQALSFVVTFGSTIIVARIVSPRDFGIFAKAGAVTTVIDVLMQFGLSRYVVREAELSRDLCALSLACDGVHSRCPVRKGDALRDHCLPCLRPGDGDGDRHHSACWVGFAYMSFA